jgi:hypothetical protein
VSHILKNASGVNFLDFSYRANSFIAVSSGDKLAFLGVLTYLEKF